MVAAAGPKSFAGPNATFLFVEVNATAVLHLLWQLNYLFGFVSNAATPPERTYQIMQS
jgi:hypothetical protein